MHLACYERSSVLLEQNGAKSRVQGTNTLSSENLSESTNQAVSETRCRDKTNASSLEGAEGDRGEELGATGRHGVDGSAILAGLFNADEVDRLLLEELITAKLECALHEITSESRTETSCESANAFVLDDLAEATNHTTVIRGGVELDSGLDTKQIRVSR